MNQLRNSLRPSILQTRGRKVLPLSHTRYFSGTTSEKENYHLCGIVAEHIIVCRVDRNFSASRTSLARFLNTKFSFNFDASE